MSNQNPYLIHICIKYICGNSFGSFILFLISSFKNLLHCFSSNSVGLLFINFYILILLRVSLTLLNQCFAIFLSCGTSLVVQTVKNMPAMQETWVQSLGQEDPLEKRVSLTLINQSFAVFLFCTYSYSSGKVITVDNSGVK